MPSLAPAVRALPALRPRHPIRAPSPIDLPRLGIIVAQALALLTLASTAGAAPRDVQMRSFDFTTGVIELRNFGDATESLDGWRFCTHDEDQIRRYSSAIGLNGIDLGPGDALFIHTLDDAPPGDPQRIDVSSLGTFALPFDSGAYGIQLYFSPVSFGNGNTIADHAQWSPGGVEDETADERSDEAETGGVWTDQAQWISTGPTTLAIELEAAAEGETLHGPGDYMVIGPPLEVPVAAWPGGAALGLAIAGSGAWRARRRRG